MENLNYTYKYAIIYDNKEIEESKKDSVEIDHVMFGASSWLFCEIAESKNETDLLSKRKYFNGYHLEVVKVRNPKIDRILKELSNNQTAIDLSSKIIDTFKSFENKPISKGFYKRLETKLKAINDCIRFSVSVGYDSQNYDLTIGFYDYKSRWVSGDYIKHDSISLISYLSNKDYESNLKNNVFKSENFIKCINERIELLKSKDIEIKAQLKKLNQFERKKNKLLEEIETFNRSISPVIDDYFNFKIKY